MSEDPGLLVAGRVVRGHGLRGEVSVDVRTDDADGRFAVGASLATDPDRGPVVVAARRWHSGRLLLRFDGVEDRDAADALRGTSLLVAPDTTGRGEDGADAAGGADGAEAGWYVHELVGCSVSDPSGAPLGEVVGVAPSPAQDLLLVRHEGREVLVPFVRALVPVVDVPARRVVVDPPGGLFDA